MNNVTSVPSRSLAGAYYDWAWQMAGEDEYTMVVWGNVIIGVGYYIFINSFFTLLDFVDPAWVQPYRIQEDESKKVTFTRWRKALFIISFNLSVVTWLMSHIFYLCGRYTLSPEMPPLYLIVPQIAFCVLVEETGFYYSHRLFHHRSIYKHFHKIHHEWTVPVSITSVYAHPVEHIIANLLPAMLGPMILNCHIMTTWTWWCFAFTTTTISHSGYHLPFLFSAEAHDYHHLTFNECFGVLGFLDTFHGTNKTFRSLANYDRHIQSFSLKPIKEIYPDKPKKQD